MDDKNYLNNQPEDPVPQEDSNHPEESLVSPLAMPPASESKFVNYQNLNNNNNNNFPLLNSNNFELEIKKFFSICSLSIWIFLFWFISAVSLIIVSVIANEISLTSSASTSEITNFLNLENNLQIASKVLFSLLIIFWVLCAGIGIVGTMRSSDLIDMNKIFHYMTILYIIGIFVPLIQLLAALMGLSKVKKYLLWFKFNQHFSV